MGSEKNLERAIKEYRAGQALERRKVGREELKEKRRVKLFWEKEKQLHSKKLEVYQEILSWAKSSVKKKSFKGIFREMDDIIIFYGGWGHKLPRYGGYGCWSRIYLDRSGKLTYWAGYKWMACVASGEFDSKNGIVKKLTYEYIKKFHNSIKSGKVYDTISEELKG
jgi:hypothetical protein